jgi:hypothetical protein
MPIKVNFSGVTDEFEAIPPGRVRAVVKSAEQKTSDSGKPYIAWSFAVKEPEHLKGRQAWLNNSLLPQALWALKRTLVALGVDPVDLAGEIELDPQDFVGSECVLVIGNEKFEGVNRHRVMRVLPAETELGEAGDLGDEALAPEDLEV